MSRPTKLSDLIVKKLEEAFIVGSNVEEACFYADISRQTFYNWIDDNPELLDRFNVLRRAPLLKARMTVSKALGNDPKLAMEYLKHEWKYRSIRKPVAFKDQEKEIQEHLTNPLNRLN
jgi:hypothetical protein